MAESMVWSFGVVEDEPLGEFLVEAGEVGEEQVFVVVDEGFLDGAIEAFGMGIHFWGLGVGIPTGDLLFREGLGRRRGPPGCGVWLCWVKRRPRQRRWLDR